MIIDLRSDTLTRPTPEMRQAMASAEVGDDVIDIDPTVVKLEEKAAALTGKEAALFMPSGCMANLIAVLCQAPAGSEILCGDQSHIHRAENGGYARVAQVNKWALKNDRFGRLDAAEIQSAIHVGIERGGNSHLPSTSLLCLENTHNYCSGTVQTVAEMQTAVQAAKVKAPWINVHLDGARLFNAVVKLNCPARDLASVADTVSFCVSKGLSSPIGSLLCGKKELITQARGHRKMLGGGMRQVGVLAACGLISISESMISRLADDHHNARKLAEALAGYKGISVDLETVQTNIVFFSYAGTKGDSAWLGKVLNEAGIKCLVMGPKIRFVTHREITAQDTEHALKIIHGILG